MFSSNYGKMCKHLATMEVTFPVDLFPKLLLKICQREFEVAVAVLVKMENKNIEVEANRDVGFFFALLFLLVFI